MTDVPQLVKATLQQIRWTKQGTVETKDGQGHQTFPFAIQFNPQTLRLNRSNQKAGGEQPAGSPIQFLGKGVTKLTLELVFDTTRSETSGPIVEATDVRTLTDRVSALMMPVPESGADHNQYIPPGVRIQWGSFLFDGTLDSIDETLDFFSSQGVPLRATVSLSLSGQEIDFRRINGLSAAAGTNFFAAAVGGASVQQMAASAGSSAWKPVALANGIEMARRLSPGTLVSMNGAGVAAGAAALGVGSAARATLGGAATARVSMELGAGAALGVGAELSTGASARAGFGVSAGAAATLSFR